MSIGIQDQLVYRFNLGVMLLKEILVFSVFLILWMNIYNGDQQIGNYSFAQIIIYYLAVSLLQLMANENIAWILSEDIEEGHILNFILKPLKSIWYFLSLNLGFKMSNLLILAPVYAILFIVLVFFHMITLQGIFWFIIFAFGSFLLGFYIFYFIGTLAFFTESSWGIIITWSIAGNFLGGNILPLDIFPDWLLHINNFLPFQYLFYIPAKTLSGDFQGIYTHLLLLLMWIGIFYTLGYLNWFLGTRKYEAYGN